MEPDRDFADSSLGPANRRGLTSRLEAGLVPMPKKSAAAAADGQGAAPCADNVDALACLAPSLQAWVRAQGWEDLRPVQKRAVAPILAGDRDVILSAATASGKTEAAFLPALSAILNRQQKEGPAQGICLLYLSPLKALINDQDRRLHSLARAAGLCATAWHGDQSWEDKTAFLNNPGGILLTTPESLESFLLRHSVWCYTAFAPLACIIVDEFHSFVGRERGKQLLSQLRRLEAMLHRQVPRIALSATLGNREDMAGELRPHRGDYPCELIAEDGDTETYLQVRTYTRVPPYLQKVFKKDGFQDLVHDMYDMFLGGHHLVFANSRARTEVLANALAARCAEDMREQEFFPHHGSLARNLRANLERRLQDPARPTTAVCTTTLELGIDIGNMDSVAQVDAPNSVSSLRQRLGRAGRRGNRQIFHLFLLEKYLRKDAGEMECLRLGLFQSLAVLELLSGHQYEPVADRRPHYSTLVQQLLSVLGQYGGVRPSALWNLLCATGPFEVEQKDFLQLLKGLAEKGLVRRDAETCEVRLLDKGQALLCGSDFGVAFRTPAEFDLENEGRILGRIPLTEPLEEQKRLLFAGRAWTIVEIDKEQRIIHLLPDAEGTPPLFTSAGLPVHDMVRETMYRLYKDGTAPAYCNHTARGMFRQGQEAFFGMGLHRTPLVRDLGQHHLVPWKGDRFCRTLARLISLAGFSAEVTGGIIDINCEQTGKLKSGLGKFVRKGRPSAAEIVGAVPEELQEKFAACVDEALLAQDNAARFCEVDAAWVWLCRLVEKFG